MFIFKFRNEKENSKSNLVINYGYLKEIEGAFKVEVLPESIENSINILFSQYEKTKLSFKKWSAAFLNANAVMLAAFCIII